MPKRWLTEEQFAHHQAHKTFYGKDPRPASTPIAPPSGLNITLPMPPSVNELYGTGPGGQKFLLETQRAYRENVVGIVHIALRGGVQPFTGRLEMWLRLHYGDRRRTDISNRVKAVEDALTHAKVYKDDSQIDRLTVERVVDPGGPEFCTVEIREKA